MFSSQELIIKRFLWYVNGETERRYIRHLYLYFSFKRSMEKAADPIMTLERMMGKSFWRMPYVSQRMAADSRIRYDCKEMSFVRFVFQHWIACGRKLIIENVVAISPRMVIRVICVYYNIRPMQLWHIPLLVSYLPRHPTASGGRDRCG